MDRSRNARGRRHDAYASAEDEGDLARYAEFVPDIYLTRGEAANV
jgi:hypothetical protein